MNNFKNIQKNLRISYRFNSFYKFFAIIFSIIYGAFIVLLLNVQHSLGSGDIASYLYFFNQFAVGTEAPELALQQDAVFRLTVFFLREFFGVETLTILGAIGFVSAAIVSFILLINIRSEKYLVYLLPLFIMVLTAPIVQALFSSNIRSGIAFSILLLAILYQRGVIKLISLGIASIVHFSMIPFVALYILFHLKNRLHYDGLKFNNTFTYILLFFASIFVGVIGGIGYSGIAKVSSSIAYNFLIFYVACLMIFTGRKLINNVFGFMSAGMIFIYFTGILIDVSYIRYIGNALLLYFLFLIQEGEETKIEIFTFGFIPYYILTASFMFSNLA